MCSAGTFSLVGGPGFAALGGGERTRLEHPGDTRETGGKAHTKKEQGATQGAKYCKFVSKYRSRECGWLCSVILPEELCRIPIESPHYMSMYVYSIHPMHIF